jgi:hypothetical protein
VPAPSFEMLRNGQACCEAAFLLIDPAIESRVGSCGNYAQLIDHAFQPAPVAARIIKRQNPRVNKGFLTNAFPSVLFIEYRSSLACSCARELHEDLGQDLVAAKMMLDKIDLRSASIEANERARNGVSFLMETVIKKIRSVSYLLHPPLLDEVGLCSAIRWYLDELNKRSGIATAFDVQPGEFPRLRPELVSAIFRVVQEALANVFRHSGAYQASVNRIQIFIRTVASELRSSRDNRHRAFLLASFLGCSSLVSNVTARIISSVFLIHPKSLIKLPRSRLPRSNPSGGTG